MISGTTQLKVLTGLACALAVVAGVGNFKQYDQVNALSDQVATLQRQLQMAQSRLVAEGRPDLPVSLHFRKAFLFDGDVAVLQNLSRDTLEITLDVESAATGLHTRKVFVINGGGRSEFGPHEGWAFAPGQRVTLNNPAYRPLEHTLGS